jgi:hypothetical protein
VVRSCECKTAAGSTVTRLGSVIRSCECNTADWAGDGRPGNQGLIHDSGRGFSALNVVHVDSGFHPTSCRMGPAARSSGRPLMSSARVRNEWST